jgi:hypothetical protein
MTRPTTTILYPAFCPLPLVFAALSGTLLRARYKTTTALIIAALVFLGTVVHVFTLPIEG